MSDTLILGIAIPTISAVSSWVIIMLNARAARKLQKQIAEYHKEVNGKMGQLLETTKALGNAEGAAEEKEKNKNT
ncbi:MAG TPA: hypothetical protein VK589_25540 [Chryseolinea sp.]|nr:hypothetical protein [Chryseolinea sp.]